MANLINRTQAAALLGVSAAAIDKALAAGRITHADPARKLFDAAGLPGQWAANRRRQRTPRAAADAPADPATPLDESTPGLQRRRLAAEVAILETKARVGHGTRLSQAGTERALLAAFVGCRGALDAQHPQLLELLDPVCSEANPLYPTLYEATFKLGRATWGNIWAALMQALIHEHPSLYRWAVEFAASESRPGSAAHLELKRMREADAK